MEGRGDAGAGSSPAWKGLLLAGTLLTSCTCSASLELSISAKSDPLTQGTGAHLTVPGSLDGILITSWFRGHKAQPEATIFSPEGLPGPGHTGREVLGSRDNLVMEEVSAQDSGNYTTVLETVRRRRSVLKEPPVQTAPGFALLSTYPETQQGVIRSELNYSVVLSCVASGKPEPVRSWTFNGEPYKTGERVIIRRLSRQHLGTYVCMAKNSEGQASSKPVNVLLAEEPTDPEPIEPDPTLTLRGGSAIALTVAGNIGAVLLTAGIIFTIIQSQSRTDRRRMRMCC